MRVPAPTPSPRRSRWTVRELALLAFSTVLILSPVGAVAYAMLQPSITIAQTAPDLQVTKIATSLGGIDIANIAPGGEFYYEMRVQTASTDAVNLTLLDSFPATVQALTITDRKGGTCTLTANQLSCSLVTSAANPASVLVRARASSSAENGTQVRNTVLVTAGATSTRGNSTLTISGPANQPSATIAAITATTAPPTNTPAPTDTVAPPTNTPAPTDTVVPPTDTPQVATPTATATASGPTPTVRADNATATSAALTVVPVTTVAPTDQATTPTATAEFTVTPTADSTLVSQGTPGPTTEPSTPTAVVEVPPTAIPATVIPTLEAPNTDAPTQQPPVAGGGDSPPPPTTDGGKEPPTSPDVTGRTLPATSGEQWLWLAPLLGLVVLFHTLRTRRARVS